MTEHKVDWLLTGTPRKVQLEALRRSYLGVAQYNSANDDGQVRKLPHYPRPAIGWAHFMEMRLGKTPTVLNEFMLLKRDYSITRALVVCPNPLKAQWASEATKFGVDVPVFVYEQSKRKDAAAFTAKHSEGLIVINYEAFVQTSAMEFVQHWCSEPCYIAADESVKIKNPKSLVFKNLMVSTKSGHVFRALTGLPSPQAVTDLWSQFKFARKLPDTNFFQFRARFAMMGGFMGKTITGIKNEDKLGELMAQSAFVARRKDWGAYLPTDYTTISVPQSPEQAEAYDSMEREFVVWLQESGDTVTADQVLAKHIKLQQISSGFVIDEQQRARPLLPFDATPKFKSLLEMLTDETNSKVIIVARHSHAINMLHQHLSCFNPAVIRGANDMKRMGVNVEDEKRRFNNDSSCRVIVVQNSAGKYGHTLTGTPDDPCFNVVFYENSYSLDDRAQMEQRPQAIDQAFGTCVTDFASTEIEHKIIDALQKKHRVSEVVLGSYKKVSGL